MPVGLTAPWAPPGSGEAARRTERGASRPRSEERREERLKRLKTEETLSRLRGTHCCANSRPGKTFPLYSMTNRSASSRDMSRKRASGPHDRSTCGKLEARTRAAATALPLAMPSSNTLAVTCKKQLCRCTRCTFVCSVCAPRCMALWGHSATRALAWPNAAKKLSSCSLEVPGGTQKGELAAKRAQPRQLQAALWKPGDVQCEARPRAVLLACEQSRSAKPPSSSSLSGLLSAATVWPRCLLRHQRKRALLQPLQLPGLEPQRPRLPPDCLPLLPALLPAPELALAMRKGTVGFALFTAYLDGLHGVIVSVCVCLCVCVCVSVFLPSISHLPGPLGAVRILNRQLIIPILRTASFECSKWHGPSHPQCIEAAMILLFMAFIAASASSGLV